MQFRCGPETTVHRHPERASYDRTVVYGILDEAFFCHVGFTVGSQPFVIPTIHVRIRDDLYLHGSPKSRMVAVLRDGVPICVTVTLLDGLVLARSALASSMNYRSAVILGAATEVTDPDEKMRVFEVLVEHVAPGRWEDARWPTPQERDATAVLRVPLVEASAKIRTGPPKDAAADLTLPVWAGVVPLETRSGIPVNDPEVPPDRLPPAYAVMHPGRGSGWPG